MLVNVINFLYIYPVYAFVYVCFMFFFSHAMHTLIFGRAQDILASNESHKSFRPITTLSFRLDNNIAQQQSTYPFHVTNVLLHTGSSLLLYMCGRIMFRNAELVLCASLFFATHPVHTESVSNITGRSDVLQTVFYLLGFLCYVKSCNSVSELSLKQNDNLKTAFSEYAKSFLYAMLFIIFTVLSLFSKENGITLPIVCMFWDYFIWSHFSASHLKDIFCCCGGSSPSRGDVLRWKMGWQNDVHEDETKVQTNSSRYKSHGEDVKKYKQTLRALRLRVVASLVFNVGLALFRLYLNGGSGPAFSYEQNPMAQHEDPIVRGLSIAWIHVHYFGTLVYPMVLSADWSYNTIPLVTDWTDKRVLACVCFYLFILTICRYGFFDTRKKSCKHEIFFSLQPWQRELGMSVIFLLVPFLLSSNILFPVGTVKAERILYLPSAGYCFMLALLVFSFGKQNHSDIPISSKLQNSSLSSSSLSVSMSHSCISSETRSSGNNRTFRQAHIRDLTPLFLSTVLIVWFGICCYQRNYEWRSGHDIWRGVVTLNPQNPHAIHNYGLELSWAGKQADAVHMLARSVQLKPSDLGNLHPLALALRLDGRCDTATKIAKQGIYMAWQRRFEGLQRVSPLQGGGAANKMIYVVGRLLCVLAYCQMPLESLDDFPLTAAATALAIEVAREDTVTMGHVAELYPTIQEIRGKVYTNEMNDQICKRWHVVTDQC